MFDELLSILSSILLIVWLLFSLFKSVSVLLLIIESEFTLESVSFFKLSLVLVITESLFVISELFWELFKLASSNKYLICSKVASAFSW